MKNERGQRTREKLLVAATEIFARTRYEDVSLGDITLAAGVAAGAANYHFGSKRGLYTSVLEANFREMWAQVKGLRGTMTERLSSGVDIILDYAESQPQSFLALTSTTPDAEVRATRLRVHQEMFDAFVLELTGGVRSAQVEGGITAAVGGAEAVMVDWLTDRALTRAEVRTLIFAGIRAYLVTALELEPRAVISADVARQVLGDFGALTAESGADATAPARATPVAEVTEARL